MNRRISEILILLLMLVLLPAGCIRRDKAMQQQSMLAEYCTVTYYREGAVLGEELIAPGKTPESIPDGYIWLDEDGERVDPAGVTVEHDVSFHVLKAPQPVSGYVRFAVAEDGFFRPDEPVTRGELAEMLCALMDGSVPEETEAVRFSDVPQEMTETVYAVTATGLMSGYGDGTFRPDDPVNRGDLAVILYYIHGEYMPGTAVFSDADESHRAYDALSWCFENGFLAKEGDGICPDATVTRGETVFVLNRFRGREVSRPAIDAAFESSPYGDVPREHWAYYDILDASCSNELMLYIIGAAPDARQGMIIIDGGMYHVNGETLRLDYYVEGFHTIDGGLYYVGQNGYSIHRFEQGLVELDGSMFYVTETDGPFLTDGAFGYLEFGADGRYTSGSAYVDSQVELILGDFLHDDSLTREEKLYKAYCAIRDGGYFYMTRPTGWQRGTTVWALQCAEVMYETKYGTCYYWTSAFLYLARRLGYQAYPVCGGVGTRNELHAWVVIEWDDGNDYIFDVELEWAYRNNFYQEDFAPDNMFKQPLEATKVIYVFPDETRPHDDVAEESNDDVLDIPVDAIPSGLMASGSEAA